MNLNCWLETSYTFGMDLSWTNHNLCKM